MKRLENTDNSTKRLDIQGLRALSIISVVIYHLYQTIFSGGYVGVDIFFVISGYVISNSISNHINKNTFSLIEFYKNRAIRILPPLFFMVFFCFIVSCIFLPPNELKRTSYSLISILTFSSNFFFRSIAGYFDNTAETTLFLHTWSLAVEEQFYLLFAPALVYLLCLKNRYKIIAVLLCISTSILFCHIANLYDSKIAFYLPFGRIFEILIGASLVIFEIKCKSTHLREWLTAIGFLLMGYALIYFDKYSEVPSLIALIPCLGAALVIISGTTSQGVFSRILTVSPVVYVGDVSYSIYLWHWPIQVAYRYLNPSSDISPVAPALLLLTFALGALSWHGIEKPLSAREWRTRDVVKAFGLVFVVGMIGALFIVKNEGFPDRFDPNVKALFAAQKDYSPLRSRCHSTGYAYFAFDKNCVIGADGARPSVAIWGDSLGSELAFAMGDDLRTQGKAVMQITSSSCPPALDFDPLNRPACLAGHAQTLTNLVAEPRINAVILVADYEGYPAKRRMELLNGFGRSARALHKAGKRVVFIYPVPKMPADPPQALGMMQWRGQDLALFGVRKRDFLAANAATIHFLDQLSVETGAIQIRPSSIFCGVEICRAATELSRVRYFDETHISLTGASEIAALMSLKM